MRFSSLSACLLVSVPAALALFVAGCGRAKNEATPAQDQPAAAPTAESHEHGDWWCAEHGVPEDVCARCNSALIVTFKNKGDWCAKHDRPASQCFVCSPELAAKFAARYEAKFGKKPPKPEPEEKTDQE